MSYPPPPWNLQGYAFHTLQPVDIERSRSLVPPELDIVSILPGKTLGGVYLCEYQSGSILQYSELIVVAGLTRHQNTVGSWISHIYVDSPDSVAGGREIWGLPKELAEFTWESGAVTVRQNARVLCRLRHQNSPFGISSGWELPIGAFSFGGLGTELLQFKSNFKNKLTLVNGQLEIPNESPLTALNLGQPWLTLKYQPLNLTVDAPAVVGTKSAFSPAT